MASIFASRCLRASGNLAHHSFLRQPASTVFATFGSFGSRALSVSVGDAIPSVSLDKGFPPTKVPLADYCKGKKLVLMGLPGAFTPT